MSSALATTIMVVPIFEPLSLHGTDGDEAISDAGKALQVCVLARPMALSGAVPEVLVESIRSPHVIPTNNPNYRVKESNLLMLTGIGIEADLQTGMLLVTLDVSGLAIPAEIDLTPRQVVKLAILAARKTLEQYQQAQDGVLVCELRIEGMQEDHADLADLACRFSIDGRSAVH